MSAEHGHAGGSDMLNDNAVVEGVSRLFGFLGMVGVLSAVLFATPQMTEAQMQNMQNLFGSHH